MHPPRYVQAFFPKRYKKAGYYPPFLWFMTLICAIRCFVFALSTICDLKNHRVKTINNNQNITTKAYRRKEKLHFLYSVVYINIKTYTDWEF
jgi:hypothetical protein